MFWQRKKKNKLKDKPNSQIVHWARTPCIIDWSWPQYFKRDRSIL